MLGALGVVYGDIGTSPLYALRECFSGRESLAVNQGNVLGILSLILWSLVVVVSVKYLLFVTRASNRGEGGVLALFTLVSSALSKRSSHRAVLVALSLFGAALLYGDGMVTPAISVLSALEGLDIAVPALAPYTVPLAVSLLIGLFVLQQRGTGSVGTLFGPVTLVWFAALAALGTASVVETPEVLRAINPVHAASFFADNGIAGFWVLGAVFLVVTGGEALYADMGHFGLIPIRRVWFWLVFPALSLNYFGQGALLLREPAAAHSPFFLLAPEWALLPLLLLATAATIIASQAMISGAFSLSSQALRLGFLPRLEIRHSSPHQIGQVYVPFVNWLLLAGTVGLVLAFRSSGNLAGAYGVAVTGTMLVTTALAFFCARVVWQWSLARALIVTLPLLAADLAFLGANLAKIAHGGWFPLVVAVAISLLMTTWKRGKGGLEQRLRKHRVSEEQFLESLSHETVSRIPGVALFMDASSSGVPRTLLHNIKHNRVVHERVLLLTVLTDEVPRISAARRLLVEELGQGLARVVARFGFMETPRLPPILRLLEERGVIPPGTDPSVFLGRETLIVTKRPGMHQWRKHLFALMARNAQSATRHFAITPGRVIELGQQVEF